MRSRALNHGHQLSRRTNAEALKRIRKQRLWRRLVLEPLEDRVAPAISGLDVSHFQGAIDWTQVATADGRQAFALVKATQGTTFSDSYFASDTKGAAGAGLVVGTYHFANPDADPTLNSNPDNASELVADADAEANFFVKTASAWLTPGQVQPVLDLDRKSVV